MTIKNKLSEKAHIFTALLMIIQPVMDIISFWFERFGLSGSITLVLRLGVLAFSLLYAFVITDRKWIYWSAFAAVVLLYAGHVFAIWQAGILSIVTDFSNYVRVIQMPLSAILLISCMRMNKRGFEGMQWGMTISLWMILAVMIISVVTGTDPGMYTNGTNFYNTGVLGWFNNTNSQSSNLSVLLPVAVITLLNAKKKRPFAIIITLVLGLLAMFFACTRLAYLAIVAVSVGIGVMILIIKRTDWKYSIVFLALAIIFVALVPVSPMNAHLNIYEDTQNDRQEELVKKIADMEEVKLLLNKKKDPSNDETDETSVDSPSAQEPEDTGLTEEELRELVKQLAPVYDFYISDFVQIFGLAETMEMYNFTMDIKSMSAVRAKKLMFAQQTMDRLPASAELFGIEYGRFTVSEGRFGQPLLNSTKTAEVSVIYDVENDFHGIFYLYGWAGLILYLAFILYFVWLIIWALFKDIKKYFTLEATAFGIALIVCLAHAYNTAGVLRRPNASIFLSATLAGIYYLVKVKDYTVNEDTPKIPKITDVFGGKKCL